MKMKLGETIVLGLVLLAVIVLVWKNINDKSIKLKFAILDIAVPEIISLTEPASLAWSQPAGTTIKEINILCTDAINTTGNAGYAITVTTPTVGAVVLAVVTGLSTGANVTLGTLVTPAITGNATTSVKRDVTLTFTHTAAITAAGVLKVFITYY
jgi:hypothetical protein